MNLPPLTFTTVQCLIDTLSRRLETGAITDAQRVALKELQIMHAGHVLHAELKAAALEAQGIELKVEDAFVRGWGNPYRKEQDASSARLARARVAAKKFIDEHPYVTQPPTSES